MVFSLVERYKSSFSQLTIELVPSLWGSSSVQEGYEFPSFNLFQTHCFLCQIEISESFDEPKTMKWKATDLKIP